MTDRPLGTILQEKIQQHHDTRKEVYNAGLDLLFEMARRIDLLEKRLERLENPVDLVADYQESNAQVAP